MASYNTTKSSVDLPEPESSAIRKLSVLRLQEEGLCTEERGQSQVIIDILPDNVLIEIFDFYKEDPIVHISIPDDLLSSTPWKWKSLTHVCRRWRDVIYGSPRRLDLRIVCTKTTPTRTLLDMWPPMPITVICPSLSTKDEEGVENIIAAIKRSDRVSQIVINEIDRSTLEKLIAAMHGPFPILTDFCLESYGWSVPVLPETFLGESAPLLRCFTLSGISFTSFPKFLLSATHIVELFLYIPNLGYVPPEVMVNCLATLPNLESLLIGHRYTDFHPPMISLPPTRAVLPALTHLHLGALCEYSEAFAARIDTPLLKQLNVVSLTDSVFEIPQFHKFVDRIENLRPSRFNQAIMEFSDGEMISMVLESPTAFKLQIVWETLDWDFSSMTQLFSQQLPLLSHVEQLEIRESPGVHIVRKHDLDGEPSQWQELFHLFIAVQNLYVSERLVSPVSVALQELQGERTMEVLPALCNLFLEGLRPFRPAHATIRSFAAARQRSDHPVAIRGWVR